MSGSGLVIALGSDTTHAADARLNEIINREYYDAIVVIVAL